MTKLMRGIRGATTVGVDLPADISAATQELLQAMLERNKVQLDDVISVIFTSTTDLTSIFPASAARDVGFSGVPLICAQEIQVPGSMPRVLRIMMHVYTERSKSEIEHVYIGEAQSLRRDLE